ncbi:MAG: tetratricopeptide repeat protein [Lishizhenia sp.]
MRYSNWLYIVFFVFGFCFSNLAQRQEKFNGEYSLFYAAEDLYEKEQYASARSSFQEFYSKFNYEKNDALFIKARYYEGLSALFLFNNDAVDLLLNFLKDYPESIYTDQIYLELGKYFYQKKKYTEAVNWLVKVDITEIDKEERDQFYFKKGYANFQLGEYKAARNSFFEIKNGTSQYANPALYYFSHIAYQDKNYQVALEGFIALVEDEKYKTAVPYYIAQIYYLQGKYELLTEFAPQFSIDSKDKDNADLNQLIGDAYYRVEKYDEAVSYLSKYAQQAETSREDNYQLGYAYYKSNLCSSAIKMFEKVARVDDELGQIASYHLGECYLKMENDAFARNAFQKAAALDFDLNLQEDALYNYALLCYKLNYNPYDEAIEALERYLEQYPNSTRKNDVYQYLVNVYSNTKNYEAALNSLDKLPSLDIKLKSAYQVIAYNRGIELYERGDYSAAREALKAVKKYPVNSEILGKSYFWTADAYFMEKEYLKAITEYTSFLSIPGNYTSSLKENAYYNIAYAYFMREDYVQAKQAFRTFTDLNTVNSKLKLADAYARLGDCFYVTKSDNQQAIQNYQAAIDMKMGGEDKSLYFQANAYGLVGDIDKKIVNLLNIVNNYSSSKYVTKSIFDIGSSYALQKNYTKAIQYFEQLVRDYPNNLLVIEALLEIADVKFKQQNFSASESYYQRVLNEYDLDDNTCQSAVKGLVDIYAALNQVEKISLLRNQYACTNIEENLEENIFYDKAVIPYNKEEYVTAIPELKRYLINFPEGRFKTEMQGYLADAYFETGDEEMALSVYQELLEGQDSPFTEIALIRSSKLLYNSEEYQQALPYYTRLEKIASTPEIIYNTRVGLMRTNFILLAYENAHPAAIKVLTDKQISNQVEVEANYIAGIALFKDNYYQDALPYLEWTAKNSGTIRGAEAQHTIAAAYYELEEYAKAKSAHKKMMNRKPAYDFWIAKSLILQARVLLSEKEPFQAENTINLVLSNYPIQDDGIIDEAQAVKAEIEAIINTPKTESKSNTQNIIEIDEEGGNDE